MGLFDDVVDFAKKNFIPKDISLEGFASTPAAQAAMQAAMMATPGVPLGLAAAAKMAEATGLDRVPDTRIKIPFSDKYTTPRAEARHLMEALDATGPGSGLDDVLMAGAKAGMPVVQKLMRMMEASPESMAVVAPLISKLGIVKPRGAAYVPGVHHFESKLAEALDKKFIAPGNPEDLISLKEIRAELGKLPGAGVKKEELSHFNLGPQIESMLSQGKTKITREELATLIDKQMPRIEVATDARRHAKHTLGASTYNEGGLIERPPDYKSYIMYAPPVKVPERTISRVTDPISKDAIEARNASLIKLQEDYDAGKISSTDLYVKSREIENAFQESQGRYIGSVEPFKDVRGETAGLHYNQEKYPNLLGWARTTRRPFGSSDTPEMAKYIEEIQSDWATKGGKENPFPLHDVNDVLMRYIDRISRQAGEEAVGWTPPVVHIDRWGGVNRRYKSEAHRFSFDNVFDFIDSFGETNLKLNRNIRKSPEWKEAALRLEGMIKGLPEFQKYKEFAQSDLGKMSKNFESVDKKRALHQDLLDAIDKKTRDSPIPVMIDQIENYIGFEDVYGRKMPKSASQIIKQRGEGTEVFNDRIAGDLEGDVSRAYNYTHQPIHGYSQPPDIGSFFYRIPKEQRGKPVPYPDSLWGLLGAAGLAGMMEAGKKDRQPQ